MKFRKKFAYVLIILLLPTLTYGILGPLEIFLGNQKDFGFRFNDFFYEFLCLSLLAWIICSLLIAFFKGIFYDVTCALILSFGVATYIQVMFMNIKLSEANGGPLIWSELHSFQIFNSIIWVLVFILFVGLCLFLKKHWITISIGTASALAAIQIVAIISLIITSTFHTTTNVNLQMSGEKQFSLATKNNIIIFVLDTFGSTQLEKSKNMYPDLLKNYSDFTYYNNADCHYYCTFPSMTHVLTGEEFNFDVSCSKWLNDAWSSDRAVHFYNQLENVGVERYLFSGSIDYVYGNADNLQGKFNNIQPLDTEINQNKLIFLMGKMSLFRGLPYIFKPTFEVLTEQFESISYLKEVPTVLHDNAEFYSTLYEKKLSLDASMNNALIIQHLKGTHTPYTSDENAHTIDDTIAQKTVKGLFVILDEYIQQMKDLGVYDEAAIIITADHASWYHEDPQPIFFIKTPYETHDTLQVNSAPISLDDLQATILSLLNLDYSDYGTSIFDWKENDVRKRTVYMRMLDKNFPNVAGSSFNVYYGYDYTTNKEELNALIANGPQYIIPASVWAVWD